MSKKQFPHIMYCQVCNINDATIFLTQIVDGNMQKINLCKKCAQEKGVSDPTGFSLADLLSGIGESQDISQGHTTLCCPLCGFSYDDFKKTGRLACSVCYDTFFQEVLNILNNMHRGEEHTGKIPGRIALRWKMNETKECLQSDMNKAISEENFEEAAILRDKLYQLNKELNKPDTFPIVLPSLPLLNPPSSSFLGENSE